MATVETQGIQTSQRRMHRFQLPGGGELIVQRAPNPTMWETWVVSPGGVEDGPKAWDSESQALTYATRWLEWE